MDSKRIDKPLDKPSRFATVSSPASSGDEDSIPLTTALTELILAPVRLLTSPQALRAYASTVLIVLASLALYFVATIAYMVFYNAYIPDTSFTVPVHMQFDHVTHPYAVAEFSDALHGVDIYGSGGGAFPWLLGRKGMFGGDERQRATGRMLVGLEYDIDVVLNMPRTPDNLEAGNFMLSLSLLGAPTSTSPTSANNLAGSRIEAVSSKPELDPSSVILAHSSRPTTLTYTSPLLSYIRQSLTMPLYVLGLRRESETVRKPMLERVVFPATSFAAAGLAGVPQQLHLEMKGIKRLHIYFVSVEVRARFSGIRWLMSRHRIFSFLVFTTMFWIVEMLFALMVWGGISLALSTRTSDDMSADSQGSTGLRKNYGSAKTEDSGAGGSDTAANRRDELQDQELDLSDVSRTFPTYSRQPPLRYTSVSGGLYIKREDEDEESKPTLGKLDVEADDEDDGREDEDADFVIDEPGAPLSSGISRVHDWQGDSGIGTSMESSGGGGGGSRESAIRRRKSDR